MQQSTITPCEVRTVQPNNFRAFCRGSLHSDFICLLLFGRLTQSKVDDKLTTNSPLAFLPENIDTTPFRQSGEGGRTLSLLEMLHLINFTCFLLFLLGLLLSPPLPRLHKEAKSTQGGCSSSTFFIPHCSRRPSIRAPPPHNRFPTQKGGGKSFADADAAAPPSSSAAGS